MPAAKRNPQPEIYYLLDRGHPFMAVITEAEAQALFDAADPELRRGNLAKGYEYAIVVSNGVGQRFPFTTRVSPIPAARLAEIVQSVSQYTRVPDELAQHAA